MNILISTDIEGICGIDHYSQIRQANKKTYLKSRELLTEETNVAVQACLDGSASKVYLIDGHGKGKNFIHLKLHKKAIFVDKKALSMVEGINKKIDFFIFIGYHGMAGKKKSFTAHSYSSKLISKIKIDGNEVNEGKINAAVAKFFGVKTLFISGTDKAVAELKIKGIRSVVEKKSLSWDTAKSYNRKTVLKEINTKIIDALKNHNKISFIDMKTKNNVFEIEFYHLFVSDLFNKERKDTRTVKFKSKNIYDGFRKMIRYLRMAQAKYNEIYGL